MFEATIIGNLGRDPESKTMPNGEKVVNFSVASNRRDSAGNTTTTWIRVSVFGKQAEACARFLKKGREVYVHGEFRVDPATGNPRIWNDNSGQPRASFEVVAHRVQFLGPKPADNGASESFDQTPVADEPF